ncbi:MAG: ATP-binding protein [Phycisphaerae bacterium]|nr:ATP-binding protein [Phycisphaerae bacterium]
MQSLKSRLIYGMIGGMVVLLIVFDFVIYNMISRAMYNQFDTSLESAAHIISASTERKGYGISFEIDINLIPEFAGNTKTAFYQFWKENGTSIRKSPSLDNEELIRFNPEEYHAAAFQSFVMNDGRSFRAVALHFQIHEDSDKPTAPETLTLVVARYAGGLLSHLSFLKYLLSIASAVIVGLVCAVATLVVKRGLEPLSSVARQIENIGENNLKSRISDQNLPTEILPIQKQLNSLLARLDASFEREKSFNANVAHELRTPLAGMRSIIDVTLMRQRDGDEYRNALSDSLSITNDLEELVNKLLMLARIESGQTTFSKEQINISDLIDKCWRPLSDKAVEAGIVFENRLDKNLMLNSDTMALSIVASNLLDNAAEYTNQGGKIWVTAQKSETGIEIIFENTGSQLTEQQAQTVFDCYWQGDKARSSTGVHFGLGLALVKQIVELLGGTIEAHTNDLFSVRIYLPFV